jgi:hypothetical protein
MGVFQSEKYQKTSFGAVTVAILCADATPAVRKAAASRRTPNYVPSCQEAR